MTDYSFLVGNKYTKIDIYQICKVPTANQKGSWNTGYVQYEGDWFIFCNIGIAARTGHDYSNHFTDGADKLVWYGKNHSHIGQPSIQSLVDGSCKVYLFYRETDRAPFTFWGLAKCESYQGEKPIQVTWTKELQQSETALLFPEEVELGAEPKQYSEGAVKQVTVNAYERNTKARNECLQHHGLECSVCSFDFESAYGELGKGFIHVHHLKQLADIGEEYVIDPKKDLRPVCPNCHAMLHRSRPALSIEQLTKILVNNR